MSRTYTFYNLAGGRKTWQIPQSNVPLSANGVEWPGGKPDPAEVQICRAFLARCVQTKHPVVGSYRLKHVIERQAGKYVSNGALLQAALDLGISFAVSPSSPNGILSVAKRSVQQPKARSPHQSRNRPR